jgi:predicted AlkP superfamily pyrophosphatase or phosphodiesterase
MKRFFMASAVLLMAININAQSLPRPKLVVGIVIDQMRWDYLYRYYNRYSPAGGFKRFLNNGTTCENTFIPYIPTVTACGHTCIFTGSIPSIHGITGNIWWDNQLGRQVYCSEDKLVRTVGSNDDLGMMSPKNMLTTTICDELKLATNFRSIVIGIAIKDRGGILSAGHSADAAYWYDNKTGDWISSTYYMNDLPKWVKDINALKLADKYYQQGWNTLYPIETYTQSAEDGNKYEATPLGHNTFPYDLKSAVGKNYGLLPLLPSGNTFTIEFAKAAITNESMGKDSITDFLTISFSTPDYIGHNFGPNSIEQEDDFLRLDKELGDLLNFLDTKIGKNQYTVFLSADHGAAHVPAFVKDHKMPGGNFNNEILIDNLNKRLKEKFGPDNLVMAVYNYQLFLNHASIDSAKLNLRDVQQSIIDFVSIQEGIAEAFILDKIAEAPLNSKLKEMITNGYYPKRCGDIQVIFEPQWIESFGNGGTTHGLWNPYDSHIPLLWYGWGIKKGKVMRETYMTDIAPTLAVLLHIQVPNGSIGKTIEEVIR